MSITNNLPIPDFASSIPLPSSSSNQNTSQTSSRKSKDNQYSIAKPIPRRFKVPALPRDELTSATIRNGLIYKKFKRPRRIAEEHDRLKNWKIELDQALEKEKTKLENSLQDLQKRTEIAKVRLEKANTAQIKAKQELLRVIKERDQKLNEAKAAPLPNVDDDEEIVMMKKRKTQLANQVKELEKRFDSLEEKWKKEDIERKEKLAHDKEERKRKVSEKLEQSQRKKQKTESLQADTSAEIARLEKEVKEINQTQSQLIWLMKQVITIQNQKKESSKQK